MVGCGVVGCAFLEMLTVIKSFENPCREPSTPVGAGQLTVTPVAIGELTGTARWAAVTQRPVGFERGCSRLGGGVSLRCKQLTNCLGINLAIRHQRRTPRGIEIIRRKGCCLAADAVSVKINAWRASRWMREVIDDGVSESTIGDDPQAHRGITRGHRIGIGEYPCRQIVCRTLDFDTDVRVAVAVKADNIDSGL